MAKLEVSPSEMYSMADELERVGKLVRDDIAKIEAMLAPLEGDATWGNDEAGKQIAQRYIGMKDAQMAGLNSTALVLESMANAVRMTASAYGDADEANAERVREIMAQAGETLNAARADATKAAQDLEDDAGGENKIHQGGGRHS